MIIRLFSSKFRNRNFNFAKIWKFSYNAEKTCKASQNDYLCKVIRIKNTSIKVLNIKQLTKQKDKF